MDLRERVRQTIISQQLLARGARVVVAVSGGADSVALLHLLAALKPSMHLTLIAAHLDHGLREASREDAAFVESLGARWNVATVIERQPVAEQCAREGWSLEEGARILRYCFLRDVARRFSAGRIATAHTADDQAETVLMRLMRGAGLSGLSAIPMRRELDEAVIIRPLLGVWRREVLAYLTAHHLAHREDASNADRRFVRNRIRHELLPALERDYNPNLKQGLVQLAEQSRCDELYLREACARQWKRLAKRTRDGAITIRLAGLRRQPDALQRQIIRRAIQQAQGDLRAFEFRHWTQIQRLIAGRPEGSLVHLPGGLAVEKNREWLILRTSACPSPALTVY
ncbi:MAG: tRNA lysidine(34) synthetase TilS [Candidatus Omnitrophica bacterium]|nr:tRNA lysidine(34) synthetase TilS [Candidatus Omnitrophota bacterium]